MGRPADAVGFVITVARLAEAHGLKYPAAAFAYYSFVSFLPLFVLVVAVLGERMSEQIGRVSPRVFTPEAQQLVSESITSATGRGGTIVLAIAVLGWSVTNIVIDLQTAIRRVEGRSAEPLGTQLSDAVRILASVVLLVVAVVLIGAISVIVPSSVQLTRGWPVGLFVVLVVALVPLYTLPSRTVTSVSEALPGALTAALGLTTLLTAIGIYAANAAQYALYGVLSGIIILLTSLYVGALILMIGFVVNVTAKS